MSVPLIKVNEFRARENGGYRPLKPLIAEPETLDSSDEDRPDGNTLGLVKRYGKHERMSDTPMALDFISAVYRDAIKYTARPEGWRGLLMCGAFVSIVLSVPVFNIAMESLQEMDVDGVLFGALFFLVAIGFAVLIPLWNCRLELFRPLDESTLFDRKHRKVYKLNKSYEPGLLGLFMPWPVEAYEFDWDLIDVEHHATLVATATVIRNHSLVFLVRRSESDPTHIDAFHVLPDAVLITDDTVNSYWEHIRRYMEENGSPLPRGHAVANITIPTTIWQSVCTIVPLNRNYGRWWRERWFTALLFHLLLPVSLPVVLLWGFFGWLSFKTALSIQWPQEVLDAIGPEIEQPRQPMRS